MSPPGVQEPEPAGTTVPSSAKHSRILDCDPVLPLLHLISQADQADQNPDQFAPGTAVGIIVV